MEKHRWVGAAYVDLVPKEAKYAARRGSVRVPEATKIRVLDVYCGDCHRPFDDCADQPCEPHAEHLRGGPIGTRKKRGSQDGAGEASAE